MKNNDAEKQVWKNETKVEELKEQVLRLRKDFDKHRESFNDYKKNNRTKSFQDKLNKRLVLASLGSGIIGTICGLILQNFL